MTTSKRSVPKQDEHGSVLVAEHTTAPAMLGRPPAPELSNAPTMAVPIEARLDASVAIVGLGYTGLPLAIAFIEAGLTVEGNRHPARSGGRAQRAQVTYRRHRRRAARGRARCRDARGPAGAGATGRCGRHLRLRPNADHGHQGSGPRAGPDAPRRSSATPPTRPTGRPSVDHLPGHDERAVPRGAESDGLIAGVDFDLAFAPERVNPGDPRARPKRRAQAGRRD